MGGALLTQPSAPFSLIWRQRGKDSGSASFNSKARAMSLQRELIGPAFEKSLKSGLQFCSKFPECPMAFDFFILELSRYGRCENYFLFVAIGYYFFESIGCQSILQFTVIQTVSNTYTTVAIYSFTNGSVKGLIEVKKAELQIKLICLLNLSHPIFLSPTFKIISQRVFVRASLV